MPDLVVVVPTRGRPENAHALRRAFKDTSTADTALVFAVDDDDPKRRFYDALPITECGPWEPMVPKLNKVAHRLAAGAPAPFAVAFMGDDHRPRTVGWDTKMLVALRELGSGVVYGDDLLQGERLCTAWAMTSDIIRKLGRMVPAPVEHMFCDNAVMDLARAADCLRYLPDVVIEHCHPFAGKAELDDGYRRVNSARRYRDDGHAYEAYRASGFDADVAKIRALREVVSCR